jgi:hypothetical protein
MSEPKFEVPAELRNMAERTIEQAEKAFDMFFEAATSQWHPLLIRERKYPKRLYRSPNKT